MNESVHLIIDKRWHSNRETRILSDQIGTRSIGPTAPHHAEPAALRTLYVCFFVNTQLSIVER